MRDSILVLIKCCYDGENEDVPIRGKIIKLEYSVNNGYYIHVNEKYPKKSDENNLRCWYIFSCNFIKITKKNKNAIKQYLKNIKNDR